MRMLWSRSASLMRTTRMSSAIARNIFRMFSACCCSWLWVLNLDSLVTPSTMCAISGPNRSSTSARLYSVSSGTSWRRAAATATGSMPSSARIWAEAMGCVTYGSPGGPDLHAVGLDGEVERPLDDAQVGLRVGAGASAASSLARDGSGSNGTSAWPTGPRSATGGAALRRAPARGRGAAPRGAPRDRGRRVPPCARVYPVRVPGSCVSPGSRSQVAGQPQVAGRRHLHRRQLDRQVLPATDQHDLAPLREAIVTPHHEVAVRGHPELTGHRGAAEDERDPVGRAQRHRRRAACRPGPRWRPR